MSSYEKKFIEFQINPKKKTAWNWYAFIFGPLWYLAKGMWLRTIILYLIALPLSYATAGLFGLLIHIYCGLHGTYHYYLWFYKNKQI